MNNNNKSNNLPSASSMPLPPPQVMEDMMDNDPARKSAQIESAAEAVLEGKQLLVDLDKRANATREAINALKSKRILPAAPVSSASQQDRSLKHPGEISSLYKKPRGDGYVPPASSSSNNNVNSIISNLPLYGNNKKVFLLCNGGTFVQFQKKNALVQLEQDQKDTARSVEEARDALKEAVAELARLEGPDSALAKLHAGFDLKAQSRN